MTFQLFDTLILYYSVNSIISIIILVKIGLSIFVFINNFRLNDHICISHSPHRSAFGIVAGRFNVFCKACNCKSTCTAVATLELVRASKIWCSNHHLYQSFVFAISPMLIILFYWRHLRNGLQLGRMVILTNPKILEN